MGDGFKGSTKGSTGNTGDMTATIVLLQVDVEVEGHPLWHL